MFWDIEIEKNKFYCHESPTFPKDVDIEKVLKSINALLVTCIIIIKLSNYI